MRKERTRPKSYIEHHHGKTSLPAERRKQVAAEIMQRYLDGEQIAAISKDYGLGATNAYALLWKDHEEQFCEAQTSRALAQCSNAEANMEAIKSTIEGIDRHDKNAMVEIAKQRELIKIAESRIKSSQWSLEKVCRRIFGAEVPQIQLKVNLGDVKSRIAQLERELGFVGEDLPELPAVSPVVAQVQLSEEEDKSGGNV